LDRVTSSLARHTIYLGNTLHLRRLIAVNRVMLLNAHNMSIAVVYRYIIYTHSVQNTTFIW